MPIGKRQARAPETERRDGKADVTERRNGKGPDVSARACRFAKENDYFFFFFAAFFLAAFFAGFLATFFFAAFFAATVFRLAGAFLPVFALAIMVSPNDQLTSIGRAKTTKDAINA